MAERSCRGRRPHGGYAADLATTDLPLGGRPRSALTVRQAKGTPFGHFALMQERQRTVIVVATGFALAVLAVAINRDLSEADAGPPNTRATFEPGSSGAIWREAAIWLGAIAAWSGISLWLYSRPPRS